VPIDVERSLPTPTALTPIHTDFTVQYQMCIIEQLPHVVLLAQQYGSEHEQVYESVFKKDEEGGLRTFAAVCAEVCCAGPSYSSLRDEPRYASAILGIFN